VRPENPPQMGQFCRGGGLSKRNCEWKAAPLGLEFALSDFNELPAAMAAMKRDGFDDLTHLSDGVVRRVHGTSPRTQTNDVLKGCDIDI
jgi:hypothetical protein